MSTRLSDKFCFLVVGSVNQRFTMENFHAENAELWEARSDEILASSRLPMIPIVLRETNTSLRTSTIPDSKRQQTTTVDYKRLINGLFLTRFVILQQKISTVMKQFELVPEIQSELGHLTKMELRRYVLDYYKHYLKGKEVMKNGWKPKESCCRCSLIPISIHVVCRRMQEVSRTETIGHRADLTDGRAELPTYICLQNYNKNLKYPPKNGK